MAGAVNHVVLLVLLGAVVSRGETEDCEALTRRQPTAQLDKVMGDWVLVWSVGDSNKTTKVLQDTISSLMELKRLADNQTILFYERNVYKSDNMSCTSFIFNMTVQSDSEHATLKSRETEVDVEVDGVRQRYNESAEVEVYSSSSDQQLLIIYKDRHGRYLLIYRREGSHQDVNEQKAAHENLKKQAECLRFPTEEAFVYDGVSDFCHRKSAPVEAIES